MGHSLTMILILLAMCLQDDLESKIAKLVARLESEILTDRDAAQQELVRLGEPAIPVLEKTKAGGEAQSRIRAALRELYSIRSLRLLPGRWRDVWFVVQAEGSERGLHLQVEDAKEGWLIREEVVLRLDGRRAGWKSEALCKRDPWLTPIRARCTTHLQQKTVMEESLRFEDGNIRSEATVFREKHEPDKEFSPPKKSIKEVRLKEAVVLQTAALPFLSLFSYPGGEARFRYIEFPDDLDESFELHPRTVEYLRAERVELEGYRYKSFLDEIVVASDGRITSPYLKQVTAKEGKAFFEKR